MSGKANKYLISVDIEGITGVVGTSFSSSKGKHYELARRYMASDVNAVVAGILKADPNAWVAVRDAHGSLATNLDLEKLHPQAHIIQGWGSFVNMAYPIDESYKGVFFVGYHAGGQNQDAVLAHTYSALIHYVEINGKLVNETGLSALCAGHYGVPVAFISGDDYAIAEAKEQLNDIIGVQVKESHGRDCAVSLSLTQAREMLMEGATKATRKLLQGSFKAMKLKPPMKMKIKFYSNGYYISAVQRLADVLNFDKSYKFDTEQFTVEYSAASQLDLLMRLNLIMCILLGIKAAEK